MFFGQRDQVITERGSFAKSQVGQFWPRCAKLVLGASGRVGFADRDHLIMSNEDRSKLSDTFNPERG
jgi:hypothetical protein